MHYWNLDSLVSIDYPAAGSPSAHDSPRMHTQAELLPDTFSKSPTVFAYVQMGERTLTNSSGTNQLKSQWPSRIRERNQAHLN